MTTETLDPGRYIKEYETEAQVVLPVVDWALFKCTRPDLIGEEGDEEEEEIGAFIVHQIPGKGRIVPGNAAFHIDMATDRVTCNIIGKLEDVEAAFASTKQAIEEACSVSLGPLSWEIWRTIVSYKMKINVEQMIKDRAHIPEELAMQPEPESRHYMFKFDSDTYTQIFCMLPSALPLRVVVNWRNVMIQRAYLPVEDPDALFNIVYQQFVRPYHVLVADD